MKKLYGRIRRFFTDTVFRLERGELSGAATRTLVSAYKLLFYTLRGMNTHRTIMQSAALTLYSTFAVIPVLALAFVIVRALGGLRPMILSLYKLFPDSRAELDMVIDFAGNAADNFHSGVLAGFGAVTLLWAVFRVFDSVEASFNSIWEVPRRRKLMFRRYPAYLAVALIVPPLWALSTSIAYNAFTSIGLDSHTHFLLTRALSLAVACLATTLLYKYIPHTAVRTSNAWRAGIAAGIALSLWQWGYVYVQGYMTSYNAIYGSFAALPLFIVWLQVSWQIVLAGCELSFALQNMVRFDSERRRNLRPLLPDGKAVSVVIVGSGNVAESYAVMLASCGGAELRQIFARNPVRGMRIASLTSTSTTDRPEQLAEADIYIIAVSDKAIAEVAERLPFPDDAIVVHTAGSVSLQTLPAKIRNRGILYALQSFLCRASHRPFTRSDIHRGPRTNLRASGSSRWRGCSRRRSTMPTPTAAASYIWPALWSTTSQPSIRYRCEDRRARGHVVRRVEAADNRDGRQGRRRLFARRRADRTRRARRPQRMRRPRGHAGRRPA